MSMKMKHTYYKFYITVLLLIAIAVPLQARPDTAQIQGSQVKAAFIYNFIKFVDWPEEQATDANEPITIGILGSSQFGDAFGKIKDSQIKGKKVVIKNFKGLGPSQGSEQNESEEIQNKIKQIGKCNVLFVCASEEEFFKRISQPLEKHHVLTISDTRRFLENGGIINFVMEEKKVRFEINMASAKRSKLEIRSKLLRLAKRVVENDIHSALMGGSDSRVAIAKR
jgi:hypothetical protein